MAGLRFSFILTHDSFLNLLMHISVSVFINDDESGLHHDYDVWLEKLAPHEPVAQYRHNDTGEDNATPT